MSVELYLFLYFIYLYNCFWVIFDFPFLFLGGSLFSLQPRGPHEQPWVS